MSCIYECLVAARQQNLKLSDWMAFLWQFDCINFRFILDTNLKSEVNLLFFRNLSDLILSSLLVLVRLVIFLNFTYSISGLVQAAFVAAQSLFLPDIIRGICLIAVKVCRVSTIHLHLFA